MLIIKERNKILETLTTILNCCYMSDLKFYPDKGKLKTTINSMSFSDEAKRYALNYVGLEVA
jgi:hypothetical protein